MPKGKPLKSPAKQVGDEAVAVIPYDALARQVNIQISESLQQGSEELKRRVLAEMPDILAGVIALARGIKVSDLAGDTYTVPPFFQAAKFLLNWGRSFIGQGERRITDLPEDTKELLRRYVEAQEGRYEAPIEYPVRDGVTVLEDDTDDDDETTYNTP